MHIKICKTCGKTFETNRSHKQYCNRKCYRSNPITKKKYSDRANTYQKRHNREIPRRYQKLKQYCHRKNKGFDITLSQYSILINRGCHYCDMSLLDSTGHNLDRKDNNKGYTITNVLPCCGKCNQIRNTHLTVEEMEIAMKAVIKYRNRR